MKYLLLAFAISACTSASSTGITSSDITCDSSLTYANFGSAFMESNCGSCHVSKENPRLATQNQVQANASKILEQAVYTDAMPQDSSMANADRVKLGQWLSCGAP